MANKKADVVKFDSTQKDVREGEKPAKAVDLDKKKRKVSLLKIGYDLKWALVGVLTALGAIFGAYVYAYFAITAIPELCNFLIVFRKIPMEYSQTYFVCFVYLPVFFIVALLSVWYGFVVVKAMRKLYNWIYGVVFSKVKGK